MVAFRFNSSTKIYLVRAVLGVAALAACNAAPRKPISPSTRSAESKKTNEASVRAKQPGSSRPNPPLSAARHVPAIDDGAVGTEGPLWVRAASPNADWVVICQAREDSDGNGRIQIQRAPSGKLVGDRARTYLIRGSGEGDRLESWIGHSPDGRWLAYQRNGRAFLVDSGGKRSIDLTKREFDARADSLSHSAHRALAFSPRSDRVAYIQKGGRVKLMSIPSGKESLIRTGPGRPWRVEFSPDSGSLRVWLITADKNSNGRLDWPTPALPNGGGCNRDPGRYSAWLDYGDPATLQIVPLSRKRPARHAGAIATLGEDIITREGDGSLRLRRKKRSRLLTDDRCGGTLIHADSGRRLALIACSGMGVRVPVMLAGPGYRAELPVEVLASRIDHVGEFEPRLVTLYPGADTVLVDMDRRQPIKLKPGDGVIAVHQNMALLRRANQLILFDADTERATKIADGVQEFGQILARTPIAYVEPYVVDLRRKTVIAKAWGPVAAIATSGTRLVASSPATPNELASGPLHWLQPEPGDATEYAASGER